MANYGRRGSKKYPIAGPKKAESTAPRPGQKPAVFQAPGQEAPETPVAPVAPPTIKERSISEFAATLNKGKSAGNYEVRGPIARDTDYSSTAISKNLAHIETLHQMASEAQTRLYGISAADSEKRKADAIAKGVDPETVRATGANKATLAVMAPADRLLDQAKESFENAHAAHLSGDAVSSTHHIQQGAEHLVNAVNHLESGDTWGKVSKTGRQTSIHASWRKDPTDEPPTISLAGAFHARVERAVNDYSKHIIATAKTKPEIEDQLEDASLQPVSYAAAGHDTVSPFTPKPKAAKKARVPEPEKERTPEEDVLYKAKVAAKLYQSDAFANAAGKAKKVTIEDEADFEGDYDAAKEHAKTQIGQVFKGKPYTAKDWSNEFAPDPEEVTPKTKPARNGAKKPKPEEAPVAAAPVAAAPVKEARYDVFNAATQAGK